MFFAIQLAIEAMQEALNRLLDMKSEKGVSSIEYAFLSVLIAVVAVISAQILGDKTIEIYSNILHALP